jgi:GntR family transcriptional regulator/MocR family aminotransferase
MSCSVPTLWQQTLADFIHEGHFWRHLKKMRASYAQRRQWLESALQAQGFQRYASAGGIQLVMRLAVTIGAGPESPAGRAGGTGAERLADAKPGEGDC